MLTHVTVLVAVLFNAVVHIHTTRAVTVPVTYPFSHSTPTTCCANMPMHVLH